MTTYLIVLLAAYLIGSIPTGVLLTRLTGAGDVRATGSGNIGATNVYRSFGRTLGVLTLLGDILKGLLPLLYVVRSTNLSPWQVAGVALALFFGHCFPIYLGFKGGKGVATALGIFAVLSPLALIPAIPLFVGLVWRFRYISLGSITTAAAMPVFVYLFEGRPEPTAAASVIALLIIWRHRSNIERLRNGTENRFRA